MLDFLPIRAMSHLKAKTTAEGLLIRILRKILDSYFSCLNLSDFNIFIYSYGRVITIILIRKPLKHATMFNIKLLIKEPTGEQIYPEVNVYILPICSTKVQCFA